jgi:hypothetical protein
MGEHTGTFSDPRNDVGGGCRDAHVKGQDARLRLWS